MQNLYHDVSRKNKEIIKVIIGIGNDLKLCYQCNLREKAGPLLHGHIARLPCAGLRLLQKKFRAAAVQMGKLACTAAQTLPGLTRMSKKAISRIANAGGDCGSALARSNLLLFTVWRAGATGD